MGRAVRANASYPDKSVTYSLPGIGPRRLLLIVLLLQGCSLFSPRDPEDPIDEAGTFFQPDTPEQVVENIQAAIAELNTPNYGRSIALSFVFRPTAAALALDPAIWSNWSQTEEQQYFGTMAAAAQFGSGHELQLNDQTISIISENRYDLDASYTLTINHNRPDLPTMVQGRLIWIITQSEDGLWSLTEWTDREVGGMSAWSTLKSEFVK